MGTPQFACPSLKALFDAKYKVVGVITQPDRASGRGCVKRQTPVKKMAQDYNIPVYQPFSLKKESFFSIWDSLSPDIVIVIAYGLIIPSWIIHAPQLGCINAHASLLPKYRGAAPINWAIIKGEKTTGITTMLIDEGLDTGDILLQRQIKIESNDTAMSLSDRLSNLAADLLCETVDGIVNKKIKPIPQPAGMGNNTTYIEKLTKQMGLIPWDEPAEVIDRLIRGLVPWPGTYSYLHGHRFKIIKASLLGREFNSNSNNAVPGQIISLDKKKGLLVKTGDRCLAILEIQPENKKKMDIWAFAAGFKLPLIGQIFKNSDEIN